MGIREIGTWYAKIRKFSLTKSSEQQDDCKQASADDKKEMVEFRRVEYNLEQTIQKIQFPFIRHRIIEFDWVFASVPPVFDPAIR